MNPAPGHGFAHGHAIRGRPGQDGRPLPYLDGVIAEGLVVREKVEVLVYRHNAKDE